MYVWSDSFTLYKTADYILHSAFLWHFSFFVFGWIITCISFSAIMCHSLSISNHRISALILPWKHIRLTVQISCKEVRNYEFLFRENNFKFFVESSGPSIMTKFILSDAIDDCLNFEYLSFTLIKLYMFAYWCMLNRYRTTGQAAKVLSKQIFSNMLQQCNNKQPEMQNNLSAVWVKLKALKSHLQLGE